MLDSVLATPLRTPLRSRHPTARPNIEPPATGEKKQVNKENLVYSGPHLPPSVTKQDAYGEPAGWDPVLMQKLLSFCLIFGFLCQAPM